MIHIKFIIRALTSISLIIMLVLQIGCNRNGTGTSDQQQLQHFEGAVDHSRQTCDPVKSDLYVRASRSLDAGDAATAEALYREAIVKYPQDPDGYTALGSCLYFMARYDEARAEYLFALQIDDQSVDALYGLGCVAHKQGHYDEARELLKKSLTLDSNCEHCHRVLAIIYDEIGDEP